MKKTLASIIFALALLLALPLSASGASYQTVTANKTIGYKEKVSLSTFVAENKKDNYDIKFSSSNSKIVSVSKDYITGVAKGTATVTVKCYELIYPDPVEPTTVEATTSSAEEVETTEPTTQPPTTEPVKPKSVLQKVYKFNVTVKTAPTAVSLDKASATLGAGEKIVLTPTITGGSSYKKSFSSSDKSIATVDSKGNVTAVSSGTAIIKYSTFNKSASCTITVKKAPTSITVSNTNNIIQKGTSSHKVKVKFSSGAYSSIIKYSIEDTKIAKVDSKGYVTGVKTGSTKLTVKAFNGVKSTVTIKVKNEALSLNIQSAQIAYDYPNVKRIKYGTSSMGKPLEAYEIYNSSNDNKYTKTIFLDFAVHGFEDEYNKDGKVLVKEGNALIKYFATHSSELKNYRMVIVPCANPDGTIDGKNNLRACSSAFGRCTAKHIDMNRDFGKFKAVESRALRDFIKKEKPKVYMNFHGWENSTIGTAGINALVKKHLGVAVAKDGRYASDQGFIIGWVHNNLKIPACLVEYKNTKSVNTTKDVKALKAIMSKYK